MPLSIDHMIQCVFEGFPIPTVTWLHNGSIIVDGSNNITKATDNSSSTLTITIVTADNLGNYTCMVSNLLGSATSSSILQMQGV